MFLIVGLGNPGAQYEKTRHNVGFRAIDLLAKELAIAVDKSKFKGLYGQGFIGNEKVILLKPQTYMNLSGESAVACAKFFDIPLDNVIMIYDDYSLLAGHIRVRKNGSSGGHNGVKNMALMFGTESIKRVRIGINEKPKQMILSNYVLSMFTKAELPFVDEGIFKAAQAIETIIKQGMDAAMNKYNVKISGVDK